MTNWGPAASPYFPRYIHLTHLTSPIYPPHPFFAPCSSSCTIMAHIDLFQPQLHITLAQIVRSFLRKGLLINDIIIFRGYRHRDPLFPSSSHVTFQVCTPTSFVHADIFRPVSAKWILKINLHWLVNTKLQQSRIFDSLFDKRHRWCESMELWYYGKLGGELFHVEDIGGNEEEEGEEDDEEEGHHFPRPLVQEVRPGDHL